MLAISPAEALAVGGFLATFGAAAFAGVQLRQNSVARRAQTLLAVRQQFFSTPEQQAMFQKIDYGGWTFDPREFCGSPQERALDDILRGFATVGLMLRIGAIPLAEARLFAPEVYFVFRNRQVHRYLAWLEQERERTGEVSPLRLEWRIFEDAEYLGARLFGGKQFAECAHRALLPDTAAEGPRLGSKA